MRPQLGDFTKSGDNLANKNFGCAEHREHRRDDRQPGRPAGAAAGRSADAGRRETIIGKYRQGVVTSTPKDTQATGAVSTTVGQ